jgi:hypothetical protein
MPVLAQNLSSSVATMRRKLLHMMDALAETGLRRAHDEINRGRKAEPKRSKTQFNKASGKKRKLCTKDSGVH